MKSGIHKRVLACTLSILQIVLQFTLVLPSDSWAQALDTDPPVIRFSPQSEGIRGEDQSFSADVSDDNALRSVVIRYRTAIDAPFVGVDMQAIGSTGTYTATLEVDDSAEFVQYYLEAVDAAGNRALQGFAFDPIQRDLIERPALARTSEQDMTTGLSTRKKIIYGVLGAVVIGALASAASDGGGDTQFNDDSAEVDVTIEVSPLR